MTAETQRLPRFEILALLVLAWGLLSLLAMDDHGVAGYSTGAGNRVLSVASEGAAGKAGLRVGDRVVAIDGASVLDAEALASLGRSAPGDSRRLRIDREGETLELKVTYAAPEKAAWGRRLAAIAVGLSFLLFTLRAWRSEPCPRTRALALMGAGLGLAFMGEPPVDDWTLRSLALLFRHALVLAGMGATLHFLFLFPRPRRFLTRKRGALRLYLPLGVYWLLLAWRVIFAPPDTGFLYNATYVVGGMLFGLYFAIGLVTAIRSFIRHHRDLPPNGPRRVLLGLLLGVIPPAISAVLGVVKPELALPAGDYWFLTLAIIPWAWATARSGMEVPPGKSVTIEH